MRFVGLADDPDEGTGTVAPVSLPLARRSASGGFERYRLLTIAHPQEWKVTHQSETLNRFSAQCLFFSSASQLTTRVIGSGAGGGNTVLIKNRFPSGETSNVP